MMDAPEIECANCEGVGLVDVDRGYGQVPDTDICPDCKGEGWRAMTSEEIDDAAANAFSDMCEGEPPISMDEHHAAAWKQKMELRS